MTLIVEARHRFGRFLLDSAFTSERGVTALFGRSGSGKTSLVRIIAGLTKPDEGRVVLDGDVLADSGRGLYVPRHKRRFATVFQEARLFPHLSVRQNLLYGRWFAPRAARADTFDDVVALLGISGLLDRHPENLSGGEKQRVAIGRALLSAPRLILMDEPLAALDEERKAEILPYLERLRDDLKIPIVYVSHSVAEVARLADRVIVLSAGKVAAAGTATEILSQPSMALAADRRETGVVLEGRVLRIDHARKLTTVGLTLLEMQIPGDSQPVGKTVRVYVAARDVMLATQMPEGISALNILKGAIVAVRQGPDEMIDVGVDCGGDILQARITRFSCERLDIAAGKTVFAIVKTAAIEPR